MGHSAQGLGTGSQEPWKKESGQRLFYHSLRGPLGMPYSPPFFRHLASFRSSPSWDVHWVGKAVSSLVRWGWG